MRCLSSRVPMEIPNAITAISSATMLPWAGEGHFIHTYQSNEDPLPSFEGEPRRVAITASDADTLAADLWESLNEENKVSLFVRYIDLNTGKKQDCIINKNGGV